MARENFDDIARRLMLHEGGFVDHPDDPGGATKWGVTLRTARSLGLDLDGDGDVDVADVKLIDEDVAKGVFRDHYWNPVKGDQLPSGVDYATADAAFNSGPRQAAKWLQRALGVTADGWVGRDTLRATRQVSSEAVIKRMSEDRLNFMRGLRHWPTFKNGWTRRVNDVREASLSMSRGSLPQKPSKLDALIAELRPIFEKYIA